MAKAGDGKKRSTSRKAHYRLGKRVTEDTLAAFHERALEAGFETPQAYLSAFIDGRAGIDVEIRKGYIVMRNQLTRIGGNLNQIAAGINSGRVRYIDASISLLIAKTYGEVSQISRFLREELKW